MYTANSKLANGHGILDPKTFKPFSKNPPIAKVFREILLADGSVLGCVIPTNTPAFILAVNHSFARKTGSRKQKYVQAAGCNEF